MTSATVEPRAGGRRYIKWAVALVVLLLFGWWIAHRKTARAVTVAAPTAVQVGRENIAVVKSGTVQSGPAISGSLMPQDQATIRAEISGPVLQTYVEQGQAVKKGALLVRLDDAALRDAVLSARSAERSAKLALDNAQTDLQRQQRLEAAGAVAPRDVETAQRTVAADQAAYADAQARLTSAQQQLDKATIRSPLSGIVSDRPVNAGDVVQPGTALVTVVDPSSMRLEGSVPADQVSELRVGAPVQFSVNGYPGRSFTGRITRINPTADPATRQVRVLVSIPNAQNALVGGLFAQGRVAPESRQGILAPSAAVDERGLTPTVMKIAQGKAQKVPVELGIRDPQTDEVEIRRGVSAGDTLLLGAAQGVTPGTAVHVVLGNEATTAER